MARNTFRAARITMIDATKFRGESVARLSFSENRALPPSRIERMALSRFPYSWRTPLGFPVVPEV